MHVFVSRVDEPLNMHFDLTLKYDKRMQQMEKLQNAKWS